MSSPRSTCASRSTPSRCRKGSTTPPTAGTSRAATQIRITNESERQGGGRDYRRDESQGCPPALRAADAEGGDHERSEEHTSELQSQSNFVCRLLLEKKKI